MKKGLLGFILCLCAMLAAGILFSCSKVKVLPEDVPLQSETSQTIISSEQAVSTVIYECRCSCCSCCFGTDSNAGADADDIRVSINTADADDGRVNINTAGAEELATLNGIGKSKAEDIIAYRDAHGSFSCTEEIMQVPGIKEASYEKIKDAIKTE